MSKYLHWSNWIRDEMLEDLGEDEADQIEADVRALGKAAWLRWIAEHIEEVYRFVEATPKQRAIRKAWREPTHRGRLLLTACILLPRATRLVSMAEYLGSPGAGYRAHARSACEDWFRLYTEPSPFWPFDQDDRFCGFDHDC